MKNEIICSNCGKGSAFYKLNCDHCKAYLRTRIVNIDLWATVSLLIESPANAFQNIIQAEHKNFVMFLSLFIGIKLFLLSVIVNSFINPGNHIVDSFFLNLLIFTGYSIVLILICSFLITRINALAGLKNRFKDNYTMFIYSFMPVLISLFLLSAVNYALFGRYWFTYNPSPFLIKPTVAWIMSGIEVLLVLWSLLLSIIAVYTQTRNKLYSVIAGIIFWGCIISLIFFAPLLPF